MSDKTPRQRLIDMKIQAERLAADYALKALIGGTADKASNEQSARHWASKCAAFEEVLTNGLL